MRSGRAPNVPTEPVPPPSQGLGPDPQPRGYIPPTPIRSPRFSNYPEAVPGPPAALRAALLSPEKCQGRNALRGGGGKRGSLGISSCCLGTQVIRPSSSSPRARSLVGKGRGRVGCKSLPGKPRNNSEPSSSSTLMKPTSLSTLMTLDQDLPNGPRPTVCWEGVVGAGVRGVDPP